MKESFEASENEDMTRRDQPAADADIGIEDFANWSTDGFLLFDEALNCVGMNPVGERLFGMSEESAVGRSLMEIVPVAPDDDDHESYANVIRSGGHFFTEAMRGELCLGIKAFKVGDGLGLIASDITELKHTEVELDKERNRQEEREDEHTLELKYIDERLQQETDRRKRLEKENKKLRRQLKELSKNPPSEKEEPVRAVSAGPEVLGEAEREARIKDLAVELSINAVTLTNLEGKVVYANPSCLRVWGRGEEGILGTPFSQFWQAEEEASEAVDMVLGGGSWTGELIAKGKGESGIEVEMSAHPIIVEGDVPALLFFSFVDITQRRRLEDKLRHYEGKFEALSAKSIQWIERLNAVLDNTEQLAAQVPEDSAEADADTLDETSDGAPIEASDEEAGLPEDEESAEDVDSDGSEAFGESESAVTEDGEPTGMVDVLQTPEPDGGQEAEDTAGPVVEVEDPSADDALAVEAVAGEEETPVDEEEIAEPVGQEGSAEDTVPDLAEAAAQTDSSATVDGGPIGLVNVLEAPNSGEEQETGSEEPTAELVPEAQVLGGQTVEEEVGAVRQEESAAGDPPAMGAAAEGDDLTSAGQTMIETFDTEEASSTRTTGLIDILQARMRRRRKRASESAAQEQDEQADVEMELQTGAAGLNSIAESPSTREGETPARPSEVEPEGGWLA